MLKYIGTSELVINDYGLLKPGDIITREDLCQSLKHRPDFKEVKEQTSVKKTKKIRR